MISPYKFTWDNRSSTEFNVLTELAFDSDNGTVETHLGREAVVSETYNGALKRVSGYKWSDSFTFQMTLVKDNFGDFSPTENRQILKWLTGRANAGFIDIYKRENPDEIAFSALGNFVNVSSYKLGNGRIVGYVLDWESVTPYAMSKLYKITKTISGPNPIDNRIIINIDTDDNQPVYPRIAIQENGSVIDIPTGTVYTALSDMVENTAYYNGSTYYWKSEKPARCTATVSPVVSGSEYEKWGIIEVASSSDIKYADETVYLFNGVYYWLDPYYFKASTTNPNLTTTSVRFINTHTGLASEPVVFAPTTVKNNNNTEKVVLDGANRVISSSSTNRIFDDDFVDWRWLALLDGKNEIAVEGNCTVAIEYRCPRKIGEF